MFVLVRHPQSPHLSQPCFLPTLAVWPSSSRCPSYVGPDLFHLRCRSLENQVLREGERDMFIKQTYSVLRNDVQNQDDASELTGPSGDGAVAGPSGNGAAAGNESASTELGKRKGKKKQRKWHLSESHRFRYTPDTRLADGPSIPRGNCSR